MLLVLTHFRHSHEFSSSMLRVFRAFGGRISLANTPAARRRFVCRSTAAGEPAPAPGAGQNLPLGRVTGLVANC